MSRHISPALVSWLDTKLAHNGLAIDAVSRKDARLLFQLAASACVGIREKTGNNDGPLVELMQSTIGSAERESWCMSFVQSMLAYAELKTDKVSFILASEHCLTVYQDTPKVQRVSYVPLPGAICIWRHGDTSNGHTGIVLSYDPQAEMTLVEANTTAGIVHGAVVRDGDGVYFTQRSIHGTGNMRIAGFLKPF